MEAQDTLLVEQKPDGSWYPRDRWMRGYNERTGEYGAFPAAGWVEFVEEFFHPGLEDILSVSNPTPSTRTDSSSASNNNERSEKFVPPLPPLSPPPVGLAKKENCSGLRATARKFHRSGNRECARWPPRAPQGYSKSKGNTIYQIYLPAELDLEVIASEENSHSVQPKLKQNELLCTPLLRVAPHRKHFLKKPALIAMHLKREEYFLNRHFIPLCSNTGEIEPLNWVPIDRSMKCSVDNDIIIFPTYHFSLFSVIYSPSYPSITTFVEPRKSQNITIAEFNNFELYISAAATKKFKESVQVRTTVHYCDETYVASKQYAVASACIKLEPHGLQFSQPVKVTIPLPDYDKINSVFSGVELELWTSMPNEENSEIPSHWQNISNANVEVIEVPGIGGEVQKVACFEIYHFSWYELVYTILASPVLALGYGAQSVYNKIAFTPKYHPFRFKALMSQPVEREFGIIVVAYRFENPLVEIIKEYPIELAIDEEIYLQLGNLIVKINGYVFDGVPEDRKLQKETKIFRFNGINLCCRFEFPLQFKENVLFRTDKILGEIFFSQEEQEEKSYILKVPNCLPLSQPSASKHISTKPITDTMVRPVAEYKTLNIHNLKDVQDELYDSRTEWYSIGLALGLGSIELDAIRQDHKIVKECFQNMLKHWLQTSNSATWLSLANAMKEPTVGFPAISETILKKYDCSQ